MSRVLFDTSVLIGATEPGELEGAISAASLAELHFGTLIASDPTNGHGERSASV